MPTTPRIRRRELIAGLAACSLFEPVWAQTGAAAAQPSGTKLILLGTKGGPRVGGDRSNPASVLLINGIPYVVDCGSGVSRQLVSAGIALQNVRYVFLTHMHSDHNLEYGGLLYNAWATGLREPINAYGPPPIKQMTSAFLESMKFDVDTRIADEGRPDLRNLISPHEVSKDGLVMQNADVRVTAARNLHPPIRDSFALRFDTSDRSIVFSGDTTRSDAVVALAKGADVLVHEVMSVPGIESILKRVPNAATLREHLLASHTTTEDVGRVATAAGVKKLVLSHFVPGDDPDITDAMWLEGVRKHYSGEVIIGKDLMVL
jgi:ribonuclease BN (tRNA processing enzyme)